jgi:hypothetical protein
LKALDETNNEELDNLIQESKEINNILASIVNKTT